MTGTGDDTNPIRVGIIGASSSRGWGRLSHVPAVQALAGLTLTAVATSSQASADAAAQAFGAARGYGDAQELTRDPEVDLVSVSVRVPSHRELVLHALEAGKHVYCEWPLGRNVAEADELRDAAAAAGVHVAIGLQARLNPTLRRARALVAEGAIGRVLSARIYSGTVAFGPKTSEASFYHEDPTNGATHLTIHLGHALDAAAAVLGGLADAFVLASTQYPEVAFQDGDRTHHRTMPDHVLTLSRLRSGAALSVEVAGGRPPDATFRFEVVGDRGVLTLDGASPRGFQSSRLTLRLNGAPQPLDEGELALLPDPAFNVGAVYAALRDDIVNRQTTTPDFQHAAQLLRLITDMGRAAATGERLEADGGPTN